jgi:hypothetical protein
MAAACVCMLDSRWRCGVHGTITPELRAAARYGHHHGMAAYRRQAELADSHYACCGEPHELGHHPACANFQPPIEVAIHPGQETLL